MEQSMRTNHRCCIWILPRASVETCTCGLRTGSVSGGLPELTADRARFGDALEDMNFGQGLPLSRDSLCPEHEHWQQRSGVNPLGAAFGCELDKDYHLRTGFHVLDEYSNWDRVV